MKNAKIAGPLSIAALLFLVFSVGCGPVSNDAYSITVLNPEPRIGKVYLSDPSGEFEVAEAWSKSFFGPTTLKVRREMAGGAKAVFRGWTERYPFFSIDAGTLGYSKDFPDTELTFEIGSSCWMVAPRFEWVRNEKPLWLDSGAIVFASNRDGGGSLWKVSPDGGAARRITVPELDGNGDPVVAHRIEDRTIAYAWRNSPFLAVRRFRGGIQDSYEVWDASSPALVIDLVAAGHPLGNENFCLLNLGGDFLWGFSDTTDSGSSIHYLLSVRRDGTARIADCPLSRTAYYATNGDGHAVFGLYSNGSGGVAGDYGRITSVCAFSLRAGTLVPALGMDLALVSNAAYRPVSISNDGDAILLCQDVRTSQTLLGTAVAVVRADGTSAILAPRGEYLALRSEGMCFNQDGSSIVAQDLSGTWGLYGLSDGRLIQPLPDRPSGASPDFGACLLKYGASNRYHEAANASEPGGDDQVETRRQGDVTDLVRVSENGSLNWLTGAGSGDGE